AMQKDAVAFMLAGLLFGVPLLGLGILTRTGTWMGWVDRYRSHHTPWYERNFFFGSIPLGLGILLLIPLGFCVGPSCRGPGLALLVLALLLMAVGMVFMIRPPRWMKAAWLIDGVDVGSYNDFGRFRDAVAEKLENGRQGSRFPILQLHPDSDGEWTPDECRGLEAELTLIQTELATLPPADFGGDQKDIAEELDLVPLNLGDSFIDVDGESLLSR